MQQQTQPSGAKSPAAFSTLYSLKRCRRLCFARGVMSLSGQRLAFCRHWLQCLGHYTETCTEEKYAATNNSSQAILGNNVQQFYIVRLHKNEYFYQRTNNNMKIIMHLVIVALATMISFAQTQSAAHLSFKGVPIDGTLKEYVSKMKQKSFSLIESEDGVATLKGDFAAYKDCIIGVTTLKQKDLVSKIAVIFPERETWSLLSSNYYSLKEMLSEKYGKPANIVEEFQNDDPKDDGNKMIAVKLDNCKYYTTYETENGSIQLSIEHNGVTSCFVMLVYFDKINSEIIKAKAKDDL
jgi:hypothetical protein